MILQVCNDWTVDSEEWCIQLWGCSSWASDWEETCWSYYASWTTESCDLGELVCLVSFSVIIFILFLWYVFCLPSLSNLVWFYHATLFYRLLQGWVKTKLNNVWIQNWRENILLKELLRYLSLSSLTHTHTHTRIHLSSNQIFISK